MPLERLKTLIDPSNERARNLMVQLISDLHAAGYSVFDFRCLRRSRRPVN